MGYLFTSESVSEGHPDKVADQISDAVLDKLLAFDPSSKVACETLVTTGQVVLAGEVKTKAYVDLQRIAREVINRIGYTKSEYMFEGNSCGVFSAIHEQSADINRGVEREDPMNQGAGDQGMMFGYATNETENYMPLSLDLAHKLLMVLAEIRREGKVMTYLRPDAKSQVTIEYDDNGKPVRIDTIVVSTQHDEFVTPADSSKEAQLKADGYDDWYFVVWFMAATGARVSELLHIKVEHVKLGYLDLYSKGGKVRRLYIPKNLRSEASLWLKRKGITSGYLFLNRFGQRITTRGIAQQLKHFADKYGLNRDVVYPHSFRHRFAKNFLDRFNDLALLADLMGHESIETTRIYLRRTASEQQKIVDKVVNW